jgi:peptidoglycan/LPS O-acetylase OafA/YrhL
LIGGHILSEATEKRFSFLGFYRLRAKRILPALYTVLLFTLVVGLLLLSPSEAAETGRSALAAVLSVSNVVFWHSTDYFKRFSAFNPLIMTWSLGVEEQFYLVLPALMMGIVRFRRKGLLPITACLCCISFLYAWFELHQNPMTSFYMLPARWWELATGVFLAVVQMDKASSRFRLPDWAGTLGFCLMIAPIALIDHQTPFPGPAALPTVIGSALVIATPRSWLNTSVLSNRVFTFVGRISYSWYLWHWPILVFFRTASPDRLPGWAAAFAVALSLGAAVVSYYLVEQPFRRSIRPPVPLLARYALVSLCVLIVCAAFWLSGGFPRRTPQLASIEGAATKILHNPCLVKHQTPNEAKPCYDAKDPRPGLALWGDSHASALAPGMQTIANNTGYAFSQFGKRACYPLIGAAMTVPGEPVAASECAAFNRNVINTLERDPRIRVVVLTGFWPEALANQDGETLISDPSAPAPDHPMTGTEILARSLEATITSLRLAGKQVVVIADVPTFDFDPLSRSKVRYLPARLALARWLGSPDADDSGSSPPSKRKLVEEANGILREVTASANGVYFDDLTPSLCVADNACLYRSGDYLLYSDSHHLTPYGANFALANFRLPSQDLADARPITPAK